MNPKKYEQQIKDGLIKYWQTKRKNRSAYALVQTLYFVIPFCFIMQVLENIQGFFTVLFVIKFLSIFGFYFVLSYYVFYNMHEKKYQKYDKKDSA
jgi:hypothetical protein